MAARVLTTEEKKMLEGLAPFNINSVVEYTAKPHRDLPEEIRPLFKVRSYKKSEIDEVRKLISKLDEKDEPRMREYARIIMVGMEKMYDAATGEPIEYKAAPDGGMDKDLFATMPLSVVTDIMLYACRISGLLAAEKQSL